MSLRIRVFLIILLIALTVAGLFYSLMHFFVLGGFIELEEQDLQVNLEKALQAIDENLLELEMITSDYAKWDATYSFVSTIDPHYMETSFNQNIFESFGIDQMAILNPAQQFVYGASYNAKTNEIILGFNSLANFAGSNTLVFLAHKDADSVVTGIILLPEGAMMVSSQPILPSNGEGPIGGTVLMGRYLNSGVVGEISKQIGVPINIARLDDLALQQDFQQASEVFQAGSSTYVLEQAEMLSGYTSLLNAEGERIMILRVDMPRVLYARGLAIQRMVAIFSGIGGLVIVLFAIILLYFNVEHSFLRLSERLRVIRETDELSYRFLPKGKDGFSALQQGLNEFLEDLEENTRDAEQGKGAQQRLEQIEALRQLIREVTASLGPDEIIHTVINLLGTRFNFYYVGVFLLDDSNLFAVLKAGTGDVLADGYRLAVGGASTVGMAVLRKELQKANIGSGQDQQSGFTRLPMARSEVAFPIQYQGSVLGVLAIQSTQVGTFDEIEYLESLQYFANQVGSIWATARFVEDLQTKYDDLEKRYTQHLAERWAEELRLYSSLSYTFEADTAEPAGQKDLAKLDLPLKVGDLVIGQVEIDVEHLRWTAEEQAIVNRLLLQTSQALETARLLERSQRRVTQERLVAEIIRAVRSSTDVDTILTTSVLELGRSLRTAQAEVRIQPSASAVLLQTISADDGFGGMASQKSQGNGSASAGDSQEVVT